jgi:hypothetical protein
MITRKLLPTLLATAVLGAAVAGVAVAADPAANPAPDRAARRAAMQQRLFDKIDANHDGVMTRAEYQAWIDGRFDRLDTKGTGVIDANDVATSPVVAARVHKRAERFIQRNDSTGTGKLSKADFEARQMQRFDRLSGGADSMTEAQFATALHRHGPRGAAGKAVPGGQQ